MKKNAIAAILSANPNADFTVTLASKALTPGKLALVGEDAVSITRKDGAEVQFVGVADIRYLKADNNTVVGSENATLIAAAMFWNRVGLADPSLPEFAIAKGEKEAPLSTYQVQNLIDRLVG